MADHLSKAPIQTARGLVFPVTDRHVLATGDDFDRTLKQEFESADAFVLLVSRHFLESDYIRDREWRWIQKGFKKVCWIAVDGIETLDVDDLDDDQRKILTVLKRKEWGTTLPAEPPTDPDELAKHVLGFHEGIESMVDPVAASLRRKMRQKKIQDLQFIAHGEVASVFEAKGPTLGRTFAIKVARSPGHNDAFLAGLEKAQEFEGIPNFIPIYEIDTGEQPCHCLSEFVRGRSIADLIDEHDAMDCDIEPDVVHRVLMKLAFALQAANEREHSHLNVKPSNIMIDEHGEPFLSPTSRAMSQMRQQQEDLLEERRGAAKEAAPEISDEALAYLLPDPFLNPKWRGETADIYMLGLIGYHLLTRKRPANIANLSDYLDGQDSSVRFREIPVPSRPDCPIELTLTIQRMAALELKHRYQTFDEVLAALMRYPRSSLARVERSWLVCREQPGSGFYDEFYRRFFHLAPEAAKAFKESDSKKWPSQRQKNLLDSAVPQLFQYYSLWRRYRQIPDALNPLAGQARQHAQRSKIRAPHFDAFGKALVQTCAHIDDEIDEDLGHEDPTLRAWKEVLRPGVEFMTAAFEAAAEENDRSAS